MWAWFIQTRTGASSKASDGASLHGCEFDWNTPVDWIILEKNELRFMSGLPAKRLWMSQWVGWAGSCSLFVLIRRRRIVLTFHLNAKLSTNDHALQVSPLDRIARQNFQKRPAGGASHLNTGTG
jgi:hypothetical protein